MAGYSKSKEQLMRILPHKGLWVLLLLVLTVAAHSTTAQQRPRPADPLELKVIAPSLIHEGYRVPVRVTLTNRSGASIFLASRDSPLDFELTWTISDSSGRELPRKQFQGFACPVGGKGWYKNLTRRMKDSDIAILQPGEALQFQFDDISDSYLFPGPGRYQVTFTYSYAPPQFEGRAGSLVDRFDAKYDLSELSPSTLEALRYAAPIFVLSNPVTLVLE
jgi:hypothetical protein